MIHWQWVIAAFFIGITLTLFLEIRRRRQLAQASTGLYLFPLILLLAAGGIWLTGYEPAKSYRETAVFISPTFPAPIPTVTVLPAPQISLFKSTRSPHTTLLPTREISETAVRRLSIPSLNLSKPIHPIPLENGIWNVAELGSDVGWLETTAVHPDDEQAMVFVGHMTFANDKLLEQGAFADVPTLAYGTAVILETTTGFHTYLVDSVRRVSPDDTEALYQEPSNSILLLTCADWNPQQGIYENRLIVRASRE